VSAVDETTVPVVTVASLRGEGILSVCEKAGAQTRKPPIAKSPNMVQNFDVGILSIFENLTSYAPSCLFKTEHLEVEDLKATVRELRSIPLAPVSPDDASKLREEPEIDRNLPAGGIGGAVQAESGGREARGAECGVIEWVGSPPTLESSIGGRWKAWRGYFSVISRI
jgi:hypothetical protein